MKVVIKKLPFDIGHFTKRDKRLPTFLPFTAYDDKKLDVIREQLSRNAKRALKYYYTVGGYASTPLGVGAYATRQGDEVARWVIDALRRVGKNITEMNVLEIGAGYGYLLHTLRLAGAKSVLGIEPGKEGIVGSKKFRVPIIRDFFPTTKLKKKVNCIVSYGTLEHIPEPLENLRASFDALEGSGVVVIGVPDAEAKMAIGDPSIISHQHVNYFTRWSLQHLLRRAGFARVGTLSSSQRTLLIGFGMKAPATNAKNRHTTDISRKRRANETNRRLLAHFRKNLNANIKKVQTLIAHYERRKKTIGLYGAGCSMLCGLLKWKTDPRIFDSDAAKHGTHIAGVNRAIESPQDLKKNPTDVMFVTSIDYDKAIRATLRAMQLPKETIVISCKDIYEQQAKQKYRAGKRYV